MPSENGGVARGPAGVGPTGMGLGRRARAVAGAWHDSGDRRTRMALDALRVPRERFDSAVADAAERLRELIDRVRASGNGKAERIEAELGAFGSDRIDADRFAGVFDAGESIPPAAQARIIAAHDVLVDLIDDGVAPHVVRMERGEDLRLEVGYTLARAGRVFGAARAATRARNGTGSLSDEALLAAFAFRDWNRAEKQIAPPLIVELDGGDLRAGGLGDFLDGRMKLVLVVRGEAPVAGLAEVVTPSVFVAQKCCTAGDGTRTDEEGGEVEAARAAAAALVRRLAEFDGPGVVALIENECVDFVHDPSRPAPERLVVDELPKAPAHGIGYVSTFRQAEAIGLLALIATATGRVGPAAGPGNAAATGEEVAEEKGTVRSDETSSASSPAPAAPADKLAAWLLEQAEIPAPG